MDTINFNVYRKYLSFLSSTFPAQNSDMSLGLDLPNCNFEDENNNRYNKRCLVKLDEWDDRWTRVLGEIMKCADEMARMAREDNVVKPSCSSKHLLNEWVDNTLMLDELDDKWTWLCDEIKKHKECVAPVDEKICLGTSDANEFYDWFSDKSEDQEFPILPNPSENKLWSNV